MESKQSFVLYTSWKGMIETLSIDQRGQLLTAIFDYASGTEPQIDDGMIRVCLSVICPVMDENAKKYEESRIKRQEAGAKGGQAKASNVKQCQAMLNDANQAKANLPIYVSDSVSVNDSVSESLSESVSSYTTPISPPREGADVYGERFDAFWNAYPKKVGKGAAEKAFKKIKPSGDLLQKMLEAIERQRRSDQWQRDNGRFIPNPATWLNQTRWEDGDSVEKMPDYSMEELIELGLI